MYAPLWCFLHFRVVEVVEQRYIFLKRLCQVLCALGGQLCALVASCSSFSSLSMAFSFGNLAIFVHFSSLKWHLFVIGFRCEGQCTSKSQQVLGGPFSLHYTFQSGEKATFSR